MTERSMGTEQFDVNPTNVLPLVVVQAGTGTATGASS